MTTEKENNIKKIVGILIQLDEKSLLLIDSGARLLAARQQMEDFLEEDTKQVV